MLHRIRLLYILVSAPFKKKLRYTDDFVMNFRVLPGDVDFTRMIAHAYFSFMSLGRWIYILRSGIGRRAWKNSWIALTLAETIQYKKSLKLFQKFSVHTKLVLIEGKSFYFEHRFIREEELVALGYSKGLLKAAQGVASAQEIFATEKNPELPPAPSGLQKWVSSLA